MADQTLSNSADKLILVVDDEKGIREFLEILMRREGFRVETAGDGAEALEKARSVSPDLILLDLMLPKSGGYEVVHELQQGDGTGDIPVLIITGRYMDRSTSDIIRQEPNVRDFIAKPIKIEALAARIHQLLKTRPPTQRPGR